MEHIKRVKSGFLDRPLFYLPLAAGLVFILILILHYGVNTPVEDQWEMVPFFQQISHHTLGVADLWRQHNEHRIFFPTLILLANAYLTHWNTGTEVLICFIFAAVTATLLFSMLSESIKQNWLGGVAGVLTAIWFFSPIQWGNWLWGWQLEWFMCATGAVATIFLLLKFSDANNKKTRKVLFTLAAFSAFIATFSLASGVFAWILGIFILAVCKESRKTISTWTTTGILSAALYYYHYTQVPTPSGPAAMVLTHHLFGFAEFFVAYLGGVVGSRGDNLQAPAIVGSLLLLCLLPLLYLVWQRRKNIRLYLPWLAIILFGLLCGLSTAFGRLGYGINFALNSRYTAFSLLYVIGITALAFTLIAYTQHISENTKRLFVWSIVLLCLPLLMSSYAAGIHGFKSQSSYLQEVKFCTHEQNPPDTCLSETYPSPQVVRPRLAYVKAKHWAGY